MNYFEEILYLSGMYYILLLVVILWVGFYILWLKECFGSVWGINLCLNEEKLL